MLQQLSPKNNTSFFLLKIFSFKDLWLFLLGIIFVSATSGSIGAFMFGLDAEEFFLGEQDNVLVVTQPGISTPFTGQVPLSLQLDIQQIPGVQTISPEILGLSVAQNLQEKSIIVRGVTRNFTSVVSSQVIEGSWFDSTFGSSNKTVIQGAMVGYILAENLGLKTGDSLVLASTLTDVVVELKITGILRTDSPSDEELIVSLSLGQTMTGKTAGYVSFLRVLIDTNVITKDILSDYLSQEFLVPISLTTEDVGLFGVFKDTPITAYTPTGQHVKTQYIESGNTTFFHLRFGSYEFVASPPNERQSTVLRIFVNQFFYSPFELSIGSSYHDLQVLVQYNEQSVTNATVLLTEQFGCQCSLPVAKTNSSGVAFFSQVPENRYEISIFYGNITHYSIYSVTKSAIYSISMEISISLNVRDYNTREEVDGGDLRISMINGTEIYNNGNYSSNSDIFVNSGVYHIEYSYFGFSHSFFTNIDRKINRTILLGSDQLHVWARDANGEGTPANVTILWPDNSTSSQITDLNGTTVFLLDVSKNYTISVFLLSNQSKIHERNIYFNNLSNLIIDFYDEYFIDIHVYNGTLAISSSNGLQDSNIQIFDGPILVANQISNSSGDCSFSISDPGNYSISVIKEDLFWRGFLLVYKHHTMLNVSLGNVRLIISTETISSHPVSNIGVSLFNSTDLVQTLFTNDSGLVEIVVPISNYTIHFSTPGFLSSTSINFTSSVIFRITELIELCGNVTIKLENQFYQSIGQAYVILRSEYYDYGIKAFSDSNGEISFVNIPWGNYSVSITYNDDTYPKQVIEHSRFEDELRITIDTSGPILSSGNYAYWQDRSYSVVWSSDFVSGFLASTLSIITTTLTTLVIIVSVLSLLSIASVISHPIVSNERSLLTFQHLGANRQQVVLGVVFQMAGLGLIASIVGTIIGMWGMTILPQFQHINIGGVIINPRIDFWLLSAILLSNVVVVIVKSTQKVNEIYSFHLPGNHKNG